VTEPRPFRLAEPDAAHPSRMSAAFLICRKPVGRSPASAPSASSAPVSRTLGAGVARIVARQALKSPDAVDDIAPCVFENRTHPYHPVPCAPFATESHFDAKRPQKGLRPTQPSGERAGVFCGALGRDWHKADLTRWSAHCLLLGRSGHARSYAIMYGHQMEARPGSKSPRSFPLTTGRSLSVSFSRGRICARCASTQGRKISDRSSYLASICRGWVSVLGAGALQFGARFVVCRHLLCLCILRRRDAFARWGEFAIVPGELP
jgi:hypothetical protein